MMNISASSSTDFLIIVEALHVRMHINALILDVTCSVHTPLMQHVGQIRVTHGYQIRSALTGARGLKD